MVSFPLLFVILVIAFKLFPIDVILIVPCWLFSVALFAFFERETSLSLWKKIASVVYALCLLAVFDTTILGISFAIPVITIVWASSLCLIAPARKTMDLALFSFSVIVIMILQQKSPLFYSFSSKISLLLSQIPRTMLSLPSLKLQQSVSLLLISLVIALYLLLQQGTNVRGKLLKIIIIQLLYLFVSPAVISYRQPGLVLMTIQLVFAAALVYISSKSQVLPLHVPSKPLNKAKFLLLMLVIVALGILPNRIMYHERVDDVVIVDTGEVMDLGTKIVRGNYGLSLQGMYSELVNSLTEYGCKVRVVLQSELNEESIDTAKLLLIIAPVEYFSSAQKADIDRFIKLGGTVLILGDHTNVFGLQGPFNDLTMPYSIEINYDSAIPIRTDRTCSFEETSFLKRIVGLGLDPALSMNYLTGASLNAPPNAEILLALKYGFSDIGDVSNGGRNAFLGDYSWQPATELMGDIILACRVSVGEGNLVAVGDTSIFQNVSITLQDAGLAFIGLSVDKSYSAVPEFVILVVAALVFVLRARKTDYFMVGSLMLCTVVALLFASPPTVLLSSLYPSSPSRAIVDVSHCGLISTGMWDDNSVTGFSLSLRRANYHPKLINKDLLQELQNAELLVAPDDSSSYSAAEVTEIMSWVAQGGKLICAISGPSQGSIVPALGASILNIPLGDWPNYAQHFEAQIHLPEVVNAWSITDSKTFSSKSLYSVFGGEEKYDLVKEFVVGDGVVIVIGDTQMLTNLHLEGEFSWIESNVRFVEELLDYLKR